MCYICDVLMNNIKQLLTIAISVYHVVHYQKADGIASSECKSTEYRSVSQNGTFSCKTCTICSPGYKVLRGCADVSDTVCQPCNENSFSRRYNSKSCRRCRICPDYSVQTRDCTSTKNSKCIACFKGSYFSNESNSCRMCSSCPKGTYTDKKCSKTEDSKCIPCPPGTYSDQIDVFPFCRPCKQCRRFEEVVQTCNATHDNECGDCKMGFFRLRSTLKCLRCSPCFFHIPGHRFEIVSECQEKLGNSDNVCMPTLDIPWRPYADTKGNLSGPTTPYVKASTFLLMSNSLSSFTTATIQWVISNVTAIAETSSTVDAATKRENSTVREIWTFNEKGDKVESFSNNSLLNPIALTGGVLVILLIIILGIVVFILVHVYRGRENKKVPECTADIETSTNINFNSALLKTSNFVKDLNDPESIQTHFSEPDLRIDVENTGKVTKRPVSWPFYSNRRRSMRDSVCSFLKKLLQSEAVSDYSISNISVDDISISNSSKTCKRKNQGSVRTSSSSSPYQIVVHQEAKGTEAKSYILCKPLIKQNKVINNVSNFSSEKTINT